MNIVYNPTKQLLLGMLLTTLSACSTAPYQRAPAPVEEPTQPPATLPEQKPEPQRPAAETMPEPSPVLRPAPTPSPVPEQKPSPAVIALLSDANRYQQQGDYRSAQSSLQRAQRIAPRDPEVYYALANNHLQQENYDLAEQVALKGVSLVRDNPTQLRRFWKLIATIRLQAGDAEGAREAEARANKY